MGRMDYRLGRYMDSSRGHMLGEVAAIEMADLEMFLQQEVV